MAHFGDLLTPLWFHEGRAEAAEGDLGPHGNFSSGGGPEPASCRALEGKDFPGNFASLEDLFFLNNMLC